MRLFGVYGAAARVFPDGGSRRHGAVWLQQIEAEDNGSSTAHSGGARRVRRGHSRPRPRGQAAHHLGRPFAGQDQAVRPGLSRPGASFAGYTKVKLDPTEVSFEKNWRRDYNTQGVGISRDISEKDVQKAVTQGVAAVSDIFKEEFTKGGYPVVTEAGPDVLWLRTGVLNVRVSAPDTMDPGRTYTFANDAGEATYFIEARDSQTGALLGRAVDRRIVGDNTYGQRNRVTNRMDFRRVVERWAELSIRGLNELKARAPINDAGQFAGAAP